MTRFGFLSTYPPTRCGIATFTYSLATAMRADESAQVRIVRVLDADESHPNAPARIRTPGDVELIPGDRASVARTAAALNAGDVAVVQHEYGIYGGTDGDDVLHVLRAVHVPVIAVLHTVLANPTSGQKLVLERVAALAASVVVMTGAAHALLLQHYAVPAGKVQVIPHGVPARSASGVPRPHGRRVLTWGLIGPGKGIEWGIRAMAHLADLAPSAHYTVLGQTHPKVLAHEGERYRTGLHRVIDELGIRESVTLDDRYLDADGLAEVVGESDVVLLPYDSREQVTSGVLVEAIAAGIPVVATGFPHAVELLDRGPGIVVRHEDPAAIAAALRDIFADADGARGAQVASAVAEATWADVAFRYDSLATDLRTAVAA